MCAHQSRTAATNNHLMRIACQEQRRSRRSRRSVGRAAECVCVWLLESESETDGADRVCRHKCVHAAGWCPIFSLRVWWRWWWWCGAARPEIASIRTEISPPVCAMTGRKYAPPCAARSIVQRGTLNGTDDNLLGLGRVCGGWGDYAGAICIDICNMLANAAHTQ